MSDASPFAPPERIGPYHVLQVIGEGGMGIVFEAEQREPVRRRVAVKMMKVGMDTREVVARFEAERQALAVMEHPGIAKVFDAGSSDDGRPYFVMELVRGVPLPEYCAKNRLDTRRRVELFIKICEAVQHAHQKGVIHRDLKPKNVLITGQDGGARPKVIDFGVAKATGQQLTEHTIVTTYGQAIGTLAYMSPEQAEMSGLDIDTRSDIYSLGVTLHELIVGKVPLDPREVGAPQFLARLMERDVSMPTLTQRLNSLEPGEVAEIVRARGTSLQRLRRELSGDLQWIVLKAMDKDRTRRYQSANGFAMDLQRYLDDEPVVARPPSAGYRIGKFVRRHRIGVAMSAAVTALVIGFAITMGVQAGVIAQERDRAEAEAAKSAQVAGFLTGLFQASDPFLSDGEIPSVQEILRRGVEQIDEELSDQPHLRTDLLLVLADVHANMGLGEEAEALFRSSLDAARAEYGDTSAVTARALHSLATNVRLRGRAEEAEQLARESLAISRALFGDVHPDVAESLTSLGNALIVTAKFDEAADALTAALEQRLSLYPRESQQVAESYNNLASVMQALANLDSAEVLHRQSLEIRRVVYPDGHPVVSTALNNLGFLLRDKGDLDGAEPLLRESLEIRRRTLGESHPRLAPVINNLAGLLRRKGELEAAEPLYLESLAMRRELYGDDHPGVALALNNIALFYRDKGDLELSEAYYAEAVEIGRRVYPDNHPNVGQSLRNLGYTMVLRGDAARAEPILREAEAVYTASLGPDDYRTLQAHATIGVALTALGRYEESERLLLDARERMSTLHPDRTGDVSRTDEFLVELYTAWGRPEEAERYRR